MILVILAGIRMNLSLLKDPVSISSLNVWDCQTNQEVHEDDGNQKEEDNDEEMGSARKQLSSYQGTIVNLTEHHDAKLTQSFEEIVKHLVFRIWKQYHKRHCKTHNQEDVSN